MTILWCGGEDIDFPAGAVPTVSTGSIRSGSTARVCIYSTGAAKSLSFSAVASAWLHFYCYIALSSSSKTFAGLIDRVSGKGIFVRTSSTLGRLEISKYDGSSYTQLAVESGISGLSGTGASFDLKITNLGAASSIALYFNGTLIIDFSGDSSISGISNLDCVAFLGGSNEARMSEFIVADEDTRLMTLETFYPNAAGDTSGFTGAYTDIDETTISDSDVIYTATPDTESQFNLSGMPGGTFIVKAVKLAYRAADGVGGIGVQAGYRTNGTTYLGDTQTLDGSWATKEELYQQNEDTSNRFTPTEMNALQMAFKAVSV